MIATQVRANPFPGLRPFEADEAHLFFGREGQADELLRRLRINRLLAVVGTSGSGKSSLVRAGLLPYLHSGFMVQAGSSWRVAIFRPGDDPIGNLAKALNHPKAFGTESEDAIPAIIMETTLRRGALGLFEVAQQARMPSHDNLLVVVDQFEELFRFKQSAPSKDSGDEAAAFVKLLLEATRQKLVPIYIVITMRSDFLGDCSQFRDLPEALNDSQYLVPRMTRDQRRLAIEGPVAVGGAKMTPRLINRLLNDVGDNPDQLPILQHALMRTWDYWENDREDEEAIDLRHYEAVGTMAKALSQHADEIYQALPNSNCQKIAEKLFKCLTERTTDGRGIRRPTKLQEICAIAEAEEAEVIDIVEKFRAPGCSFLMPPVGTELHGDSVLDISHESLMRSWEQLKDWLEEENLAIQIYRRLADTSVLYQQGKAALWRDPELTIAQKWLEKNQPNAAWAKRYNSAFEQAMNFLKENETEARKNEIEALIVSSEAQFLLNRGFDALMISLKAGKKLKQRFMAEADIRSRVVAALQQAVYQVNEFNRFESHTEGVLSVSFSPDGKTIATASGDKTVHLWTLQGKLIQTLKGHESGVNSVAFSPEGKTIASASDDNTVRLWDLQGQLIQTLKGHEAGVTSVVFSPDGQTITSASDDKTVRLWNLQGQLIQTLKGHESGVTSVAFSPDGKTIASASWIRLAPRTIISTIRLWNLQGQEIQNLKGHNDEITSIAFSPDGETIASASNDKTVRLWNLQGENIETLEGHNFGINSVAFSPDGKTIASASNDRTIRLWNLQGQVIQTLQGHDAPVNSVAFSPDGETLVSASGDKTVRLWHLQGHVITTLKGHDASIIWVAFSPDGKTIASASRDRTVRLWNLQGEVIQTLQGHGKGIYGVAFSPDGKTIVSASEDKTVRLWNLQGQEIKTLSGHSAAVWGVAFSPDGKIIASGSNDDTVKLWNLQGEVIQTLSGHSADVVRLAFSPDGKIIASGSNDDTMKLWNLQGQVITTLSGHSAAVWGVAFSPDGKTLASASKDKTVKLWNFDLDDLLVRGCDWVGDYLKYNPNVSENERALCD